MTLFLPNQQNALTNGGDTTSQQWYQYFQSLNTLFSINGVLKPTAGGTGVANALTSTITLAGPFAVATHGGTIAFPTASTTMTMPSASKTLAANDFSNVTLTGDVSNAGLNVTVTHVSGANVTLAGDVTGAANANTVAKINGNPLGSTTPTTGNALIANGTNWVSTPITHGATGIGGGASTSTSGTGTMAGLAGSITPVITGNLAVTFAGAFHHSNAGGSFGYQIYYGTGSAPASGAAIAGTATGNKLAGQSASALTKVPAPNIALITGLTIGTTYWFDIAFDNGGAGTATLEASSIGAFEV